MVVWSRPSALAKMNKKDSFLKLLPCKNSIRSFNSLIAKRALNGYECIIKVYIDLNNATESLVKT